jgi:hypothetical protein
MPNLSPSWALLPLLANAEERNSCAIPFNMSINALADVDARRTATGALF